MKGWNTRRTHWDKKSSEEPNTFRLGGFLQQKHIVIIIMHQLVLASLKLFGTHTVSTGGSLEETTLSSSRAASLALSSAGFLPASPSSSSSSYRDYPHGYLHGVGEQVNSA